MTALLFNPLAKPVAKPSVFNVTLGQSGLNRTFGPLVRPTWVPTPIFNRPAVKPSVLPPPPSINVTPAVSPPLLNLTPVATPAPATAAVPALVTAANSVGAPSAAGTSLTALDDTGAPTSDTVPVSDTTSGMGGIAMLAGAALVLYLILNRKR